MELKAGILRLLRLCPFHRPLCSYHGNGRVFSTLAGPHNDPYERTWILVLHRNDNKMILVNQFPGTLVLVHDESLKKIWRICINHCDPLDIFYYTSTFLRIILSTFPKMWSTLERSGSKGHQLLRKIEFLVNSLAGKGAHFLISTEFLRLLHSIYHRIPFQRDTRLYAIRAVFFHAEI